MIVSRVCSPPEHGAEVRVGDGETHHGQDVGDQEEDDLITVIIPGLARVTIRPHHQTRRPVSVLAVEDGGGVEQGGGGEDDGHGPDSGQHARGHAEGEVRGPGPGDGHVALHCNGCHRQHRGHDTHVCHEVCHSTKVSSKHPVSENIFCLNEKVNESLPTCSS